ncbi:hypothetical protein BT63DRAFT_453973 [Microthyrium microscopicum]|uniref:GH16 domain-containing protein n=1 Tax=Microthyrium microscopicum TaxID=703497 RepID=A0A6A6UFB7_9PEZI|nr:hypothetical protein BT63DRAFT_453973 [Microthyrium microscopicum]
MSKSLSLFAISAFSLISSSYASGLYINPDVYDSTNFFSKFNFFTDADPTHGYVDYQTQDQATQANPPLISTSNNAVKFGADFSSVVADGARGRKSIRLESQATYTKGLFIADIAHMPGSACGSWPAFWTLGGNWPHQGEIDIIEGVNFYTQNAYTLHSATTGNCLINNQPASVMNGTLTASDCGVYDSNGNYANPTGCSIKSGDTKSFGDNFNSYGGGVQVMQWTSDYIKMWFFERNNIPASLKAGSTVEPNICEFGRPDATFNGCNFDTNFSAHQIIIDQTFCGDFAAQTDVYAQNSAQCPQDCVTMVQNNPSNYASS